MVLLPCTSLKEFIVMFFSIRSLSLFFIGSAISIAQTATEPFGMNGNQFDVDAYGNIVVLDTDHNVVRLYSKERVLLREIGGSGWENDQFDRPAGLWARNGIDIFVADYGNHRIQRFDRKLNFISSFSTRESSNPDERFGYPTDVALSRLGDLYICDSENSRIIKVNRFNKVERSFGGFDAGKGRLHRPTRLHLGPKDFVYVLDGNRIVVFDSFGNYIHDLEALTKPASFYADSDGIVVLDENGLYCFDYEERSVRSIPIGAITERPDDVRSITISRGLLYIMTDSGLTILPDPCSVEGQKKLDK